MTATSPERFSTQGVWMILAGMAAGALTAWVLRSMAFDDLAGGVIASGAVLLPPAIANAAYRRRRARRAEVMAHGRVELARPPLLVIAITAGTLLVTWQAVVFVVGFVVGIGLSDRFGEEPATTSALTSAVVLVAYPIMLLVSGGIGARSAHYLPRHTFVLLLAAVALAAALQFAIDWILGSFGDQVALAAIFAAGFAALAYGAVAIGAAIARSRHRRFVATRLLRKLTREELEAITAQMHRWSVARLGSGASGPPAQPPRPSMASAGPPAGVAPGPAAPMPGAFAADPYAQGRHPQGRAPAGQQPAGRYPSGPYPAAAPPAGQRPMRPGPYPAGPYPAGPFPAGPPPAGQPPAGPPPAGPRSTGGPRPPNRS